MKNYTRITVGAFPIPKDKWLYAHTYSAKISFITEKGAHIHTADWEQFLACAISPKPYLDEVQKSSDQHCANNRFLTIMGHCFSPFSGAVYYRGNLNNHIGSPSFSCPKMSILIPVKSTQAKADL